MRIKVVMNNFTPREKIDESRYIAKCCEKHGWFASMLRNEGLIGGGIVLSAECPVCREESRIRKIFGESQIPRRFAERNFENYVVAAANQKLALESCQSFADNFTNSLADGRGLLLIGTCGTGKTHLACATLSQVIRAGHSGFFTSVDKLLCKIKSTWAGTGTTQEEMIRRFTAVDLLVLDEIGAYRSASSRDRDLLFEVINNRYESLRPTIFVSNLNLTGADSIEEYLEERSFDRVCESSQIVVFNWPSWRRKSL
ncbi:ATP-binding protein [uncultured Parasutterella sp.]|uniref:ATP-binding protein n=2 Tax=uncultured Parasutterella sp. TaxID=1263098 RepID=UPI00258AF1AE|nr:ATP-binding protein [uncultured Parasutterella sp.]